MDLGGAGALKVLRRRICGYFYNHKMNKLESSCQFTDKLTSKATQHFIQKTLKIKIFPSVPKVPKDLSLLSL